MVRAPPCARIPRRSAGTIQRGGHSSGEIFARSSRTGISASPSSANSAVARCRPSWASTAGTPAASPGTHTRSHGGLTAHPAARRAVIQARLGRGVGSRAASARNTAGRIATISSAASAARPPPRRRVAPIPPNGSNTMPRVSTTPQRGRSRVHMRTSFRCRKEVQCGSGAPMRHMTVNSTPARQPGAASRRVIGDPAVAGKSRRCASGAPLRSSRGDGGAFAAVGDYGATIWIRPPKRRKSATLNVRMRVLP